MHSRELGTGRYGALSTLGGSTKTSSSAGTVDRVDAKRSAANRTAASSEITVVGKVRLSHLGRFASSHPTVFRR